MNSKKVRIYLCGSIKKGDKDNRPDTEFWSLNDENLLQRQIDGDVELLNPAKTKISRKDYFLNFGCDLYLVGTSDFLVADLRGIRGIGVGAELMYAKQVGVPVISWLPTDTPYRRDLTNVFGEDLSDWIHPFAFSLSDYIEESLYDVCKRVNSIISGNSHRFSKDRTIDLAIRHYKNTHPTEI